MVTIIIQGNKNTQHFILFFSSLMIGDFFKVFKTQTTY